MKRPRFTPLFVLPCLFLGPPAPARESPRAFLDDLRRAAGAPVVQEDDLLSRTARDWAAVLAAAGILSHRGADGTNALDRYRAHGGTEVRVGEIIGAGPDLAAVEKGWNDSAAHRGLIVKPYWTHDGWGSAGSVWVVVFCQKLVMDLDAVIGPAGFSVTGRFITADAAAPRLMAGVEPVEPRDWDGAARSFAFRLPATGLPGYLRLGYLERGGRFVLTNVFTSPRGTESPGGKGRSAVPGASP